MSERLIKVWALLEAAREALTRGTCSIADVDHYTIGICARPVHDHANLIRQWLAVCYGDVRIVCPRRGQLCTGGPNAMRRVISQLATRLNIMIQVRQNTAQGRRPPLPGRRTSDDVPKDSSDVHGIPRTVRPSVKTAVQVIGRREAIPTRPGGWCRCAYGGRTVSGNERCMLSKSPMRLFGLYTL